MWLTLFPVSIVAASVGVLANSNPCRQSVLPHSVEKSSVWKILDPFSLENSVFPLTFITFAVFPAVGSISLRLVVLIFPRVLATVHINALAFTLTLALVKVALVVITVRPNHFSDSVWNASFYLPFVLNTSI